MAFTKSPPCSTELDLKEIIETCYSTYFMFNKPVVSVIKSVMHFMEGVLLPTKFRSCRKETKVTTATSRNYIILYVVNNIHSVWGCHTRLRRQSQYCRILGDPNQLY